MIPARGTTPPSQQRPSVGVSIIIAEAGRIAKGALPVKGKDLRKPVFLKLFESTFVCACRECKAPAHCADWKIQGSRPDLFERGLNKNLCELAVAVNAVQVPARKGK